jgi:hypothetical protein
MTNNAFKGYVFYMVDCWQQYNRAARFDWLLGAS